MAEALAMVGLASALVQFIEFGGKVLRQLRRLEADVSGVPAVFQSVRSRLPLMVDLVKKIMLRMDAGLVDENSQEMIYPVVRSCAMQAEQLDELIARALPHKNESSWSRGKKAITGVLIESEVERIDTAFKANFNLLAQASTFHMMDGDKRGNGGTGNGLFNFLGSNVHVTVQSSGPVGSSSSDEYSVPMFDVSPPAYGQSPPSRPSVGSLSISRASSPAPKASVFMVPFNRDPNFLGRRATLDDIDERFSTQPAVALAGLGGIGKTQIAIEYAYMYHDRHPEAHVFWVYASDPVRFEESYHHIARRMTFPGWDEPDADSLQLVYDGLSSDDCGKWLFILDNADDESLFHGRRTGASSSPSKTYARYIPKSQQSSVLITTRDRRVGERLSGRQRPIDVSVMTPAESIELLRSKMVEEDWDEDDAMKLRELPDRGRISRDPLRGDEDAKELLSEHLEDPRREIDTENSVMRTWKLSFDQISKNAPRAADILSIVAVLDYHSVPVYLLRKPKETETGFRTALGALQAFSLLTATRGKDAVCKTHRLVAMAGQRWLEARGTLSRWQGEAVRLLAAAFPGPGKQKYAEWPLYEAMVPHTTLALGYELEDPVVLLEAARLMVAVSLYHMSRGRYERALDYCHRSLEIRQSLLPADDVMTIDCIQTLGEALLHCGDLEQAAATLRKAVAGREKTLGPEHPDTLESCSDLTITLLELDDLDAAEVTALRALHGRKRVLGEDDPDTLVSLNIHCMVLHRKGKLDDAGAQYAETLQRREAMIGEEHPDTIITRNNYARYLYDTGDLEAARAMLDRVLAGEAKVLGSEGYDIQVSLCTSALLQAARGDIAGADQQLRKVLKMREKLLGGTHPSTIFTLQMLADLHSGNTSAPDVAQRFRRMIGEREKRNGGAKASALLRAGLLFD
ncbi:hypothetical protein B0T16DRAFT_394266 [Cercophora newfieldiana]|uniref:Uncharacterized protein n=1 Tax=Cercophora newfieldiana TaxID=92897 RepID=A0AA39XXV0_9PEZI|nr:hypothetical protein B0T16DRAFT_394266 [Cercophora newfieldiana]